MADRTFAADGDPLHSAPGAQGRPFDADTRRVVDDADALAGVARRLQARLDRQLWLLERMQGDPLQPEPAQLPELIDIARRIRRDSESLLLLDGRDPGVRDESPQGLRALLDAAAAAAEEPRRVEVRPAPSAAVVPGAATELLHVLAELLDHTTAVYPGGHVRVGSHIDSSGAITVEVRSQGATRHDPDGLGGQRALDAAERLAARSRHGIVLQRELAGGDLVASVVCPRAAVIAEAPAPPFPSPLSHSNGTTGTGIGIGGDNGNGNGNGNGRSGHNGGPGPGPLPIEELPAHPLAVGSVSGAAAELNMVPTPESGFDPVGLPELEPAFASASERVRTSNGSSNGTTNGSGNGAHPLAPQPKIDELFGPIGDIPIDPESEDASTPIFEAIASAWFRELAGEGGATAGASSAPEWETPGDREWRAAEERANRTEPAKLTAQGLPMRRPGNQLVPPPRSRSDVTPEKPAEKVAPEHVRERLGGYQRGVQRGRHRADTGSGTDPGDPEFW